METIVSTTYKARDGKIFLTEEECKDYESKLPLDIEKKLKIKDLDEDKYPILRSLGRYNPETRYWAFKPESVADMNAMRKHIQDETGLEEDTDASDEYDDEYDKGHLYIAVLDWEATDTFWFVSFEQFVSDNRDCEDNILKLYS